MRIVFVSHEYPPEVGGGIGTYVATMSRVLAERGHAVSVVTVSGQRYPQRDGPGAVEVIRLPLAIAGGPEPMATLRCWQARSEAVARLLERMIAAEPVDLIEFGDYRGEGTAFLAACPPEKRPLSVVRLHTPLSVLNKYNAGAPRHLVLESFEHEALLNANRVVSPSLALAKELREFLPSLGGVDLSPHPVDPRFLETPAGDLQETGEVLYVGRLEQRKGVETLIAAAPALLEACPEASLHLVGGDLPASADIPSMQAHLLDQLPSKYRGRVVFHGVMPRDQLRGHYARARMCVFPSLFENFPNTCLEAMALGRPTIGTDNSGMAEMIEEGYSGVLARSGDVEDLAGKMIGLFRQPAEVRREMGAAARERVRRLYHPDRIAERVEALYGGYLADAGRAAVSGRKAAAVAGDRPGVAVVIPCYNHGAYIRETLESVRAQDWPAVETVVVDDGSTDEKTVRVLDELRGEGWNVIRQENQGLSAARNTGVRATDAPFFIALDADDRIEPEFIRTLIGPLLKDGSLGYSYSHVRFFGAAGGVWQCPAYDPRKLLVENLSVATAVVRRAAFDLVGGYSRDMVHGFEDWDFWLALLSAGFHGHCTPQPLFGYRKHPPGKSMLDKTQRHRAEMVQKMVEHHRDLFASMLEVSMTDKDAMFFHAHMEAARLRETAAGAGTAGGPGDSALYQALEAQAELDYIENSNTWKTVQRIKRNRVYRWLARLRYGAGWDQVAAHEGPIERLARIKVSRFYRLIQAVKRTSLYQWHARRKYGPDFGKPRA